MSNSEEFELGNIRTQWSLVQRAHLDDQSGLQAMHTLVMRYAPAIARFVRIVVRDESLAEELAQEAMVRLLKGDFAGADPRRGRFRDLLKTAIRNMARNYWAKENRRKSADIDPDLVEMEDDSGLDRKWSQEWRERTMVLAWQKLESFSTEKKNDYYRVLKVRSQFPDDSSVSLAEHLSNKYGKEVKPDSLRQQLKRARTKFVEFLLMEIAEGLSEPSPELIHDELIALDLYLSVKESLPSQYLLS